VRFLFEFLVPPREPSRFFSSLPLVPKDMFYSARPDAVDFSQAMFQLMWPRLWFLPFTFSSPVPTAGDVEKVVLRTAPVILGLILPSLLSLIPPLAPAHSFGSIEFFPLVH